MRALIIEKLISTRRYSSRSSKVIPIRPSLHPAALCRSPDPGRRAASVTVSPMCGIVGKISIAPDWETLIRRTTCLRPRSSMTAVVESDVVARLAALVEHAAHTARYHRAIETIDVPRDSPTCGELEVRKLKDWLFSAALIPARSVARASLASDVQPVYGRNCTSLGVGDQARCLEIRDFQGMRVRFKGLFLFTALTAPAGFAFAQTAAPVAKPPVAPPQPATNGCAQPAVQQPAPWPNRRRHPRRRRSGPWSMRDQLLLSS